MYGQRLNESVYQCRVESAPQEAPPVVLIGRLSSVIVWRFHRQVLKLAEVFRFIVFQGAIAPERFHRRTSICRMEERENKSHIFFRQKYMGRALAETHEILDGNE